MFTMLSTKLDKAIIASVIAMIGFNLLILTQQLGSQPQIAYGHSAAAHQA